MSDDDFALLVQRVILVVEDPCQRVREYRQGFVERHPMLGKIGCSLPRVPFKLQSYPSLVRYHKEEKNRTAVPSDVRHEWRHGTQETPLAG